MSSRELGCLCTELLLLLLLLLLDTLTRLPVWVNNVLPVRLVSGLVANKEDAVEATALPFISSMVRERAESREATLLGGP